MVEGAVVPGIVGKFMVIPERDKCVLPMCFLQIGIRLVLCMAGSVVCQADRFHVRIRYAPDRLPVSIVVRIFVDIVAEMYDRIQIGAAGY